MEDEEELELLLFEAELLLEGEENRLVEARRAADMLLDPDDPDEPAEEDEEEPLEEDPAVELTDELGVELLDPPPPRPKFDRLPRSRGLMSDAKFSAAVTPVSRMVRSRVPETTGAVRMAEAVVGVAVWEAVRRESTRYNPTPPMIRAIKP